jgi:signal transduction histidine kinase
MRKPLLICVFVALCDSSFYSTDAQPLRRLNSFSYNINEGLLQSSIIDMNFDGFGFMWISFETGLQRYDGTNFTNISVQNGLPDNQYIKFLKSRNGRLWLCHSKGISVYNPVTNHFKFIFPYLSRATLPAIWPVNEDDGIVYFYESDGYIVGINENTLQVASRNRFPYTTDRIELPEEFNTVGIPVNHQIIICFKNKTLLKWNLKSGSVTGTYRVPPKYQINGVDFYELNSNEVMFFSGGQLNVLNIEKKSLTVFSKSKVNKQNIDGTAFENTNGAQILMSVNNELFQFNTGTMQPMARLVNFQNQPFAHFAIRYIRFDLYGNIYLITRNEGFIKLLASTYPISYYGSDEKQSNFITCLEVDKKNNRVLAGTLNSGFLVFDTLQQLRQHVEQIGAYQQPGPLTITGIIHVKNNDYLLFPRFNQSCVLWNASTNKFKPVPIKVALVDSSDKTGGINDRVQYYCSALKLAGHRELLAIDQNFYQIDLSNSIPAVKAFFFTYRTKGLSRFNNYILSGTDDQLLFRDAANYSVVKRVPLPGCGEIRCISVYNDFIYVGTNHGVFKLNKEGKIINVLNRQTGLPDDYIYSLELDERGNTWCSTNKGIIKINTDNSILYLKKEDGLQENEFNTNVAVREENGELFFGGVNGINSFYPDQITKINYTPEVLLTNIRVNDEEPFKDSAIWELKELHLPYDHNNLDFEFTAFGKRNPDQYMYQYKMSGIDQNWVKSNGTQNARYLLQPGHYTFQIYAGDAFSDHPNIVRTLAIIISPPFWKTWWLQLISIVIAISIVALIVRQNLNRKYQKNLRALQLKNELQHERERISRDLHDNIGAQMSFISSNIDWIIDKNKELNKDEELRQMIAINSTAKNVMINLRETIWALHKDEITLQEFSDKLKAYIQNMLQLQPGIEFVSKERIEKNPVLTPTEMLNIFRICQEGVNNILKHAHASSLKVIIESVDNSFHIYIEDNGTGFNASLISGDHYGLRNMKHRAREAGADLSINTIEGKGTIIRLDKYYK